MSADSWSILTPIEQSIKRKIEAVGTPLKEWNIQINYGIKTGLNDAFIISSEKKDELIAEDPKSAELIRPILRGRDIKRYSYNFSDLWLINSHNGIKSDNIDPINIDEYPAIKAHLDLYYSKLAKRADKGDTPYNLRNCVYMNDFFQPKIIFQEMVQSPSFVLDNENNFFCLDTGRIITGENLEYLLGLMNSNLFFYAVKYFYGGGALGEKGIRMKHTFFGNFPAIIPSENDLETIRNNYYSMNSNEFDKFICDIVYKWYGFTPEEIKTIESVLN